MKLTIKLWWRAFRGRWFERPIGVRDLWRDIERKQRGKGGIPHQKLNNERKTK